MSVSRLQVAIDGPAGSGKSTVGARLAERLGCRFLDTGLMYRAVTSCALHRGIELERGQVLADLASKLHFELGSDVLLVNGRPAGAELRSPQVDANVSIVSAHPRVREIMVSRQRQLAEDDCIVMVGRDIGTTVLPSAPAKLWLTASPATRAERRLADVFGGQPGRTTGDIASTLNRRDHLDAARPTSPLRRATDAIVIETDGKSVEETVREALAAVRSRIHPTSVSDAT